MKWDDAGVCALYSRTAALLTLTKDRFTITQLQLQDVKLSGFLRSECSHHFWLSLLLSVWSPNHGRTSETGCLGMFKLHVFSGLSELFNDLMQP